LFQHLGGGSDCGSGWTAHSQEVFGNRERITEIAPGGMPAADGAGGYPVSHGGSVEVWS